MTTEFCRHLGLFGAVMLTLSGVLPSAMADVVSPVQSSADPLKLPVVAPVELAGSDAAAAAFMSALPSLKALVNADLPEYKVNTAFAAANPVTLSDLLLTVDSEVRVYFVSEGASYRSSLGLNVIANATALPTASTAKISSNAEWVFPDVSSNDPTTFYPSGNSVRTATAPLSAGDFVDLGTLKAGSLMDFFLGTNAVNGGSTILTAETARNSDAFQHIVAFQSGNYLILSFEDAVGGGDKDYNDAVIAIEISPAVQTPEPGTWAALVFLCGAAGVNAWRKFPLARTA